MDGKDQHNIVGYCEMPYLVQEALEYPKVNNIINFHKQYFANSISFDDYLMNAMYLTSLNNIL